MESYDQGKEQQGKGEHNKHEQVCQQFLFDFYPKFLFHLCFSLKITPVYLLIAHVLFKGRYDLTNGILATGLHYLTP